MPGAAYKFFPAATLIPQGKFQKNPYIKMQNIDTDSLVMRPMS
jgi:hypothetical protein